MDLPAPLPIPWTPRPLSSAATDATVLPDGRIKLWIRHDVLRGVTPAMLVWWLQNLDGDIELAGRRVPRYRAWHPLDHLDARYQHRAADGTVGPGTVLHLREVLGRDPRWTIELHGRIEQLDETGFVHEARTLGAAMMRVEHGFAAVAGGTRCTSCLVVGLGVAGLGRAVNPLIRRRLLPADEARAWLTHTVEEVGNLDTFLPALYAHAHEPRRRRRTSLSEPPAF